MNNQNKNKEYYTIGEVSNIVNVKEHVIRFWEKNFNEISPNKQNRNRRYNKNDIDIIINIKKLLKEDKYTIEGAKKILSKSDKYSNSNNNNKINIKYLNDLQSIINKTIQILESNSNLKN